jgi:hypothetical protein
VATHHVLVDVVRDHEDVVLLAEVGDLLHFGAREHFAERVAKIQNSNFLCTLGNPRKIQNLKEGYLRPWAKIRQIV